MDIFLLCVVFWVPIPLSAQVRSSGDAIRRVLNWGDGEYYRELKGMLSGLTESTKYPNLKKHVSNKSW